jgi:hypothetical protein
MRREGKNRILREEGSESFPGSCLVQIEAGPDLIQTSVVLHQNRRRASFERLRPRCSGWPWNVLKVLDDETKDGSVAEHAPVGDGREDVEVDIGKDGALAGHDVGVDAGADAASANVVREGRSGEVAQEFAAGSHFASALAPGEPGGPCAAMRGCEEDGAADRWY